MVCQRTSQCVDASGSVLFLTAENPTHCLQRWNMTCYVFTMWASLSYYVSFQFRITGEYRGIGANWSKLVASFPGLWSWNETGSISAGRQSSYPKHQVASFPGSLLKNRVFFFEKRTWTRLNTRFLPTLRHTLCNNSQEGEEPGNRAIGQSHDKAFYNYTLNTHVGLATACLSICKAGGHPPIEYSVDEGLCCEAGGYMGHSGPCHYDTSCWKSYR